MPSTTKSGLEGALRREFTSRLSQIDREIPSLERQIAALIDERKRISAAIPKLESNDNQGRTPARKSGRKKRR